MPAGAAPCAGRLADMTREARPAMDAANNDRLASIPNKKQTSVFGEDIGSRDRQSDHADCDHQRLEPGCDRLPYRSPGESQGRGGVTTPRQHEIHCAVARAKST